MAEDKFDQIVGSGNYLVSAGSYKDADGNTRYKWGIRFNLPEFTQELLDKITKVGIHRVISVKAAGTFNQAAEYGTKEDAVAFAEQFGTLDGWVAAFAKAVREKGERVSGITPLIACARDIGEYVLAHSKFGKANTDLTKDELKAVRADVRAEQKENTALWQKIMAKAPAELEVRRKKAEKMMLDFE